MDRGTACPRSRSLEPAKPGCFPALLWKRRGEDKWASPRTPNPPLLAPRNTKEEATMSFFVLVKWNASCTLYSPQVPHQEPREWEERGQTRESGRGERSTSGHRDVEDSADVETSSRLAHEWWLMTTKMKEKRDKESVEERERERRERDEKNREREKVRERFIESVTRYRYGRRLVLSL